MPDAVALNSALLFTYTVRFVGELLIVGTTYTVRLAMLLVTANTMAQSVRERTPEFAVLKTLGFTDTTVLGFVLVESVLIGLMGGCLGLGLAVLIAGALQPVLSQFLPSFKITIGALYSGVAFMVLLGVLAGVWPAWSAMRLRIVVALRRG